MKVIFWIQMLYSIPSIILYIIIITLIIRDKKKFTGSFYNIFILQAIVNTCTFLNTVFIIRVPNNTCFDCFPSSLYANFPIPVILPFFMVIRYHMAFCQFFVIFLTCFNRCTVIWAPHRHEQFWKHFFWPSAFLTVFGPLLFTGYLLGKPANFIYRETLDGYILKSEELTASVYFHLVIFEGVVVVLTLLANGAAIARLGKHLEQAKKEEAEKSLFRIGFANCAIQITAGVMTIMNYRQAYDTEVKQSLTAILLLVLPYVSDLLTLSNPWLMLAFNRSMRARIMGVVGVKGGNLSSVTSNAPKPSIGSNVFRTRANTVAVVSVH